MSQKKTFEVQQLGVTKKKPVGFGAGYIASTLPVVPGVQPPGVTSAMPSLQPAPLNTGDDEEQDTKITIELEDGQVLERELVADGGKLTFDDMVTLETVSEAAGKDGSEIDISWREVRDLLNRIIDQGVGGLPLAVLPNIAAAIAKSAKAQAATKN